MSGILEELSKMNDEKAAEAIEELVQSACNSSKMEGIVLDSVRMKNKWLAKLDDFKKNQTPLSRGKKPIS